MNNDRKADSMSVAGASPAAGPPAGAHGRMISSKPYNDY